MTTLAGARSVRHAHHAADKIVIVTMCKLTEHTKQDKTPSTPRETDCTMDSLLQVSYTTFMGPLRTGTGSLERRAPRRRASGVKLPGIGTRFRSSGLLSPRRCPDCLRHDMSPPGTGTRFRSAGLQARPHACVHGGRELGSGGTSPMAIGR